MRPMLSQSSFSCGPKRLSDSATDEVRETMRAEAKELRARKLLAKFEQMILDEIERKKKYAAYSLRIDETKTQAITQKSTAVPAAAFNRMKAALIRLGIRGFNPKLKKAAERLDGLRTPEGEPIPPNTLAAPPPALVPRPLPRHL